MALPSLALLKDKIESVMIRSEDEMYTAPPVSACDEVNIQRTRVTLAPPRMLSPPPLPSVYPFLNSKSSKRTSHSPVTIIIWLLQSPSNEYLLRFSELILVLCPIKIVDGTFMSSDTTRTSSLSRRETLKDSYVSIVLILTET
mmetsp:Transcript_1545/g.2059  ORF Transcript_1545/g.2059 Transcript_1545/m.2059 type:complete len:143 (+) Transcript_1545:850-1278(+)